MSIVTCGGLSTAELQAKIRAKGRKWHVLLAVDVSHKMASIRRQQRLRGEEDPDREYRTVLQFDLKDAISSAVIVEGIEVTTPAPGCQLTIRGVDSNGDLITLTVILWKDDSKHLELIQLSI
jgi:hypothetical protein